MKKLSVSIAAYNSEKYIKRCLDSFLDERILNDIELFVIDDGGSDKTLEIAKQYESKYPGTVYAVHKENGGHGSTINTSIKMANGKYFKVVDADDWVNTQGLVSLLNHIDCTEADVILNPYVTVVEGTDNRALVYPFRSGKKECKEGMDIDIGVISNKMTLPMHSITFRTDVLKESDYRITEHCFYVDSEYTCFYIKEARTVYFIDEVVYCYRIGANEQSVSNISMKKRRFEHLTVCKNLYKFYLKEEKTLYPPNRLIIYRRLIDILNVEYKILLSLERKEDSLKEIKEVISWLFSESKEVFKRTLIDGSRQRYKYTIIMGMCIFSRFYLFNLFHFLCIRKIKKQ